MLLSLCKFPQCGINKGYSNSNYNYKLMTFALGWNHCQSTASKLTLKNTDLYLKLVETFISWQIIQSNYESTFKQNRWLAVYYLFIYSQLFFSFRKMAWRLASGSIWLHSAKANIWDIVLVIQWRPQWKHSRIGSNSTQGSISAGFYYPLHFDSSNVSSAFVVRLLRRADGKQRKRENALHCAEDSCMFGISSQTVSVCCLVYFRASVAASSSGTILL